MRVAALAQVTAPDLAPLEWVEAVEEVLGDQALVRLLPRADMNQADALGVARVRGADVQRPDGAVRASNLAT